ncbi:MAG TPA: AMP-binding protein [Pyrinomonadaceae bacterium]|nr:AMP-binding protein [Pyrinomonadaceae bacterium]
MNEQHTFEAQAVAWEPSPEVIERAQLTKFMRQTGAANFDEVYAKSIENVEEFTKNVLEFLKIEFNPPYTKLLDTSDGIEWAKWCANGGLNITEMCIDRWAKDETTANQPAIIWEGEEGNTETFTYTELLEKVELCAAGLRAEGFAKGDAIGIHLPMIPETVILLLAIGRIGAIAIPVFSGYGVDAIASRMNAVGAKAIFTTQSFPRRGKPVNAFLTAVEAAAQAPTIKKLFIVQAKRRKYTPEEQREQAKKSFEEYEKLTDEEKAAYKQKKEEESRAAREEFFKDLDSKQVPPEVMAQFQMEVVHTDKEGNGMGSISFGIYDTKTEPTGYKNIPQVFTWANLLEKGVGNSAHSEPTLAEDPLIILYTSGTTGKPKGIAHTHCGFPVKAAQDMAFGTDVGVGTRISWVTDIGWMMGPWLIYGALINGATICIYDGAPDYPHADRMWEFCAKHRVEILGISPTLVRSLATKGDDLPKRHDLSSLRAFASTGEPWNPAPWWWLFETVGNSELPIINYSGGTEISGGILMGNPLLPIKPCSFPAPCLGIDVAILDEQGNQVEKGKVGELSIRKPWIGMARGFWNESERYLETYWNRFDNIWVHGDWALQDADGHFYILGRSDDTLKVAGKRVGPAEVESLLVAHPWVNEAAVIGVPDEIKGTAMVAFCVLNGEETSLFELRTELKELVAKDMGKPLAPSKIIFVPALPKTRNAKVMRRVIRSAYLGEDAGDLSALENPQAVEAIIEAAKG